MRKIKNRERERDREIWMENLKKIRKLIKKEELRLEFKRVEDRWGMEMRSGNNYSWKKL